MAIQSAQNGLNAALGAFDRAATAMERGAAQLARVAEAPRPVGAVDGLWGSSAQPNHAAQGSEGIAPDPTQQDMVSISREAANLIQARAVVRATAAVVVAEDRVLGSLLDTYG